MKSSVEDEETLNVSAGSTLVLGNCTQNSCSMRSMIRRKRGEDVDLNLAGSFRIPLPLFLSGSMNWPNAYYFGTCLKQYVGK